MVDHLERIQEPRLRLGFSDSLILSRFSSPALPLPNLQLSTDGYPPAWFLVPFDGDTPALRTLRLIECQVPWHLFELGCLTTLRLHYVPSRLWQSMPEFVAAVSYTYTRPDASISKSPGPFGILSWCIHLPDLRAILKLVTRASRLG